MAFISAFMVQALPIAIYSTLDIFTIPPFILLWFVTSLTNLGGLLNFIAYTYVRQRFQHNRLSFISRLSASLSKDADLNMDKNTSHAFLEAEPATPGKLQKPRQAHKKQNQKQKQQQLQQQQKFDVP